MGRCATEARHGASGTQDPALARNQRSSAEGVQPIAMASRYSPGGIPLTVDPNIALAVSRSSTERFLIENRGSELSKR